MSDLCSADMIPSGTIPCVLRHSGAALLLACGFAVCLPQTASATCGDYLAHPLNEPMAAHQTSPESPHPLPPPCHGPRCRQSNVPVAPTVPFSVERANDHWAFAVFATVELPKCSAPRSALLAARNVSGYPLALERPPR